MFIPLKDLNPRRTYPFINTTLILVNVLVFLYQYSLPPHTFKVFMTTYATIPARFPAWLSGHAPLESAFVPLLTSMFLHSGVLHIAGNMLFLWIFGDNVEDYLGHFRYLVFYLVSGLAAGATHILINQASRVPSIGASGAIAGVMGAYFILYPRARVLIWFFPIFFFHVPAWLMLGYWFVMNFLSGTATAIAETSQTSGGIAFWAHIGGFVAGVIMINLFRERPHRYRYGTW